MITKESKDQVLKYLCSNFKPDVLRETKPSLILADLNIEFVELKSILNQLNELGYVSDLNLRYNYLSFVLTLKAFDFLAIGGFTSQFELIKDNLLKLHLEIENLKKDLEPDYLDKLDKISNLASSIGALFGF